MTLQADSPRTARPGQAHARRWRASVFVALTGLVALHVVDDSFLQPPPGTAAADHAVSGLLLLAALALAVCTPGRVRPGTAAVSVLAVGALGLVLGGEAAYYGTTVGLSGDDYTGLAALVAGAVLIGAGVTAIWRSRRADGGRVRRYARRAARAVAAALVVAFVVQPIGGAYLETHVARAEVPTADLGAGHEDVVVRTQDGLHLAGWYVPSRNGAAVLVFPGRSGAQAHARMLVRHGYGVLVLDRRGEGASEGAPHAYGWDGQRDVHAAVAFLQQRPDVDARRVGALGLSVGGEMLLQAASESPGLAAVVSDGAGVRSTPEALPVLDPTLYWALPMLAVHDVALMAFADTVAPPRLLSVVARIGERPVLLIADPDDGAELERVNRDYRRAIGPTATLWELPGTGHTRGLTARPVEYERRVVTFFDQALLGPAG